MTRLTEEEYAGLLRRQESGRKNDRELKTGYEAVTEAQFQDQLRQAALWHQWLFYHKHVRHAWEFLGPAGRLVSVMSPGFTFRSDRIAREFRKWAGEIGAEWEALPDGSFAESGTQVRTVMFWAEKDNG